MTPIFPGVEDGAHLFETGHAEAVCLVDHNQRRRICNVEFFRGALL
jgi:hypothetical protein